MSKKPKIRKPKKQGSAWKLIIFILIIMILAAAAVLCMSALNYKPTIRKDDPLPFETLSSEDEEYVGAEVDNVDKPKKTSTGKYVRSKDDFYTFLVLGKDSVGMNTDVIMLISFNITKDEIAVMQIPRDTYIELNGTPHKINSVYASLYVNAKRSGETDPINKGMKDFVDLLQKNMNVKIDYYAIMNLDGFKNIIDILDGIEIDVPFNMKYSDPEQNLYIDLQAGLQTLDGDKAEQFVRFRSNYIEGDIGRVNAQKLFMTAFLNQLSSKLTLTKIPKVAAEVIENVTTSMILNDCIYFAKNAMSANLSNTVIFTMPGTDARADVTSGAWYYIMRRADTLTLINRYFNVYTEEITNSIFDINQVFNAEHKSHINQIYKSTATADINDLIYTVDDIDENGVNIPLLR